MTRLHRDPPFPLPITADDVCCHALAAFHRARIDCQEFPDQDPAFFVVLFLDLFRDRVLDTAGNNGVHDLGGYSEVDAAFAMRLAALPSLRAMGAGRSPANEGQGCPALPSAVGPALQDCQSRDITLHGGPLFCALSVQELPVGETLPILQKRGRKPRD